MKVAKLVTIEVTARVIVEDTDTEEQIMEKAFPILSEKMAYEQGENITTIKSDLEVPYGDLSNESNLIMAKYKVGDEVLWSDPDDGLSSGYYKVTIVNTEDGRDSIYTISDGNSEVEVYEHELE